MKKRKGKTMRGFAATPDPRGITRQAEADVERGLQDTDCRGTKKPARSACVVRARRSPARERQYRRRG